MRFILHTLVTAVTASCTAAAMAGSNAWGHHGHDARNSYANPAENAITPDNFAGLRATRSYHGLASYAPVQGRDGVLFQCTSNSLQALDAATAKTVYWEHVFPQGRCHGPVRRGDSVWVVNSDGLNNSDDVMRLDAATGAVRWSVRSADPGMASGPTLSGDTLVIENQHFGISVLDANTGALRWSATTSCDYVGQEVIADGRIFVTSRMSMVGCATPSLRAYDAATGALLWTRANVVATGGVMVADDLLIVVEDGASQLMAYDVATGATRWSASGLFGAGTRLAQAGREVLVSSPGSDDIQAHDLTTGAMTWQLDLPRYPGNSAAVVASNFAVTAKGVFFTISDGFRGPSYLAMLPRDNPADVRYHPLKMRCEARSLAAANGRIQVACDEELWVYEPVAR